MNIFNGVTLSLFILVHATTIFTSNVPTVNYPVDSFAISCGSSSKMKAGDGRAWLEDVGSISSSFHTLSGKSITSDAPHQAAKIVDPMPYNKARVSPHEFTYTFHVRPGQKFIRLHFFPAAYKGFERSTSIFTVKADPPLGVTTRASYGFLLNNCKKLRGKKFRITRLRLRFIIKVDIPGNFEVISFKRKPGHGIGMHEEDEGSMFCVQDSSSTWYKDSYTEYQNNGFLNFVSSSPEKRVVFKKALQPGIINVGFVSLETQKFYEYGEDEKDIPLFMLIAVIRTPGDPKRTTGISFTFDRTMEYLLD